jgi:recombination protein RecR
MPPKCKPTNEFEIHFMSSIQKLTDLFAKFPTVGKRTARRFVAHLIHQSPQEISELTQAIGALKNSVSLCQFCFNPHESGQLLCPICQNPQRDRATLCLVEKEADLASIEQAGRYKGLYFILGAGSGSKKIELAELRLAELRSRLINPQPFGLENAVFGEIILATNPTPEGRIAATAALRAIKEVPEFSSLKITRLAQGLPVGGELEYADEETLESAFEGRK